MLASILLIVVVVVDDVVVVALVVAVVSVFLLFMLLSSSSMPLPCLMSCHCKPVFGSLFVLFSVTAAADRSYCHLLAKFSIDPKQRLVNRLTTFDEQVQACTR